MSRLRSNIIANFIGRAWGMALGVICIPLYIHFLGIEAYGLIGFFAVLQSLFGVFDLGLGITLNREMARLSVQDTNRREQRDFVRTLETVYWLLAAVIGAVVVGLTSSIQQHWLQPRHLTPETVHNSIRLMALVMALQFPFSLYQGGLLGLQRQVLVNGILIGAGTFRSVGAVAVLWLLSPSIELFFAWQVLVSGAQSIMTAWLLWQHLPGLGHPLFRTPLLRAVWPYAASVAGNALIGVSLTQLDKVLLSKLLTLDQFGYYALASTLAATLWGIIIPLNTALFPRFAQLVELREEGLLADLYHRGCQMMSVALLPVALTTAAFSWHLVLLWTRSVEVANQIYLVVSLLVLGTSLNGIVSVAFYLQSAAGWPQLAMYSNLISAAVLVPATLLVTPRFGGPGAAAVWLALNAGYLAFSVPIMHRRLLRNEKWRWYLDDVGAPLAAVLIVISVARALPFESVSPLATAAMTIAVWLAAVAAAALAAGSVRGSLIGWLRRAHAVEA